MGDRIVVRYGSSEKRDEVCSRKSPYYGSATSEGCRYTGSYDTVSFARSEVKDWEKFRQDIALDGGEIIDR
jgi:hypothetical protein